MRGPTILSYLFSGVAVLTAARAHVGTAPGKTPKVQTLPSLREQAELLDGWTEERKALIPQLLRKYGVDAWLVSLPCPVFYNLPRRCLLIRVGR